MSSLGVVTSAAASIEHTLIWNLGARRDAPLLFPDPTA
jgi:hypothetical protein